MKKDTYDYSCLMVDFDLPNWVDFQGRVIDPNDIVNHPDVPDSLPHDCHITVLYGLLPEVSIDDFKSLLMPLDQIEIHFTELDFFQNKGNYDVLKFNAQSDQLSQLNQVMKTLPYFETFPGYEPHMTIAYLHPDTAQKYLGEIKPFTLKPANYYFSKQDGTSEKFTV